MVVFQDFTALLVSDAKLVIISLSSKQIPKFIVWQCRRPPKSYDFFRTTARILRKKLISWFPALFCPALNLYFVSKAFWINYPHFAHVSRIEIYSIIRKHYCPLKWTNITKKCWSAYANQHYNLLRSSLWPEHITTKQPNSFQEFFHIFGKPPRFAKNQVGVKISRIISYLAQKIVPLCRKRLAINIIIQWVIRKKGYRYDAHKHQRSWR